jgi:2-oxoisovalerate dehydrogenase E1 component
VQDRVEITEANLDRAIDEAKPASRMLAPDEPLTPHTTLTAQGAVDLFTDQVRSRALDVVARELKQQGAGYYTISSAGHEGNAVFGALLRPTDPAFLHYRSGAFMMARARHNRLVNPLRDTLLSLMAAAEDPIAQGRHKVWGSHRQWVPPQTSTIASHLPKAVGTAFAIERARRIGVRLPIPADGIVYCSFGDGTVNHATALAGINAARYGHRRGSPTPILFVCEDNGIGISVETPRHWVERTFSALPHLHYVRLGGEIDEIWEGAVHAIDACRESRRPVFVHLDVTRLWGHAGSDVETGYRTLTEIMDSEAADPVPAAARRLISTGAATADELRAIVAGTREYVRALARELADPPRLDTREAVTAPLAPYDEDAVRGEATGSASPEVRGEAFGGALPEWAKLPVRRTMAAHLGAALTDELARRPEMLVFGEDVGRKGGVYYVTGGLQKAFGPLRVFDTLLDETTILGTAQGCGLLGLLPVPEIQYLAYLHNALDQLRGEASSLQFFSSGQFSNPMVVRVAGLAYQKGFGGHFHNDNAIGALRDIPGLVLAVPARGDDAARMLRGCIGLARACGRVVVFLEPIALYHERDLYAEGDGRWLTDYPPPGDALLPGEVAVYHPKHRDVLVVTYGNGVRMSLRAARQTAAERVRARVLDLRWLNPLPLGVVREHAEQCRAVLVADEGRATGGGVADAVVAALAEGGYKGRVASVRSADSFVPLGPAAEAVLLTEEQIVEGLRQVASRR